MKSRTIFGAILALAGILALAYQGITYTKRKKVVDVGPIHATKDTTQTIPLPPIVGALALVAGVVLIVMGSKK